MIKKIQTIVGDAQSSIDKTKLGKGISERSRKFLDKHKVDQTSAETTSRAQRFKTELKGTLFGFKKPAGDGGGKEAPQEPGQFNVKNDGKFEFKKATRPAGDGGGEEAPLEPGEADKRTVRFNIKNDEEFEFKKDSPPAEHGVNGSSNIFDEANETIAEIDQLLAELKDDAGSSEAPQAQLSELENAGAGATPGVSNQN